MVFGNNGILHKAGEAKERTDEFSKDEEIKVAVLGSYGSNATLDINKLLTNLSTIKDITVTSTEDNGTNTFPVTVKTQYRTYKISSNGDFSEIIQQDRTGIKVGDYVTYISPTESVNFNAKETGYTNYDESSGTPATLLRKTLFRVLNINEDGSIDLIGIVTSSDQYIYLYGTIGYNNAVYTLDKKCNDLYKNSSLGITARSIKEEDITTKLNSTGLDATSSYIRTTLNGLSVQNYITAVDKTNRKVTYKRARGYYPDIFQYETGGLLDGIITTGEITNSQAYSGYNGLTSLTYSQVTNQNGGTLTLPETYYNITPTVSYFDNTNENASIYKSIFFGTGTYYWLSSRCISCQSGSASFMLRRINSEKLGAGGLYSTYYNDVNSYGCICPIVTLSPSTPVTVCTGENSNTNTHIVVTE